jgi:uncharacterized protein YdhG (YjbR/CyaY superfamily)
MKRSKPGPSAPGAALSPVDEYLAGVPEPAHGTLQKIRAMIRAAAPPEATEAISYGIPAFRCQGALVGYAAFKDHCSFFPMSAALIEQFKSDLKKYSTSTGTIRFPLDKPLPKALVTKIVKARVAQNASKKRR